MPLASLGGRVGGAGMLGPACVPPAVLPAAGSWQALTIAFRVAFGLQYPGLLAKRWIFFAQANHPQSLFYQAVA